MIIGFILVSTIENILKDNSMVNIETIEVKSKINNHNLDGSSVLSKIIIVEEVGQKIKLSSSWVIANLWASTLWDNKTLKI